VKPKTQDCGLRGNPDPLGWGDHVRWMHVHNQWEYSAGRRHSEARRGANDLRRRVFDRLWQEGRWPYP
jgi:hypothetical protein